MKFQITIWSPDRNIESEITQAKIEGITIRRHLVIREIINPPIDFIVYVGEHIALPIAASLIARFLYDKLKGKKETELIINNQPVEISAEKIEQLIIKIEKEEKE